MLKLQTSGPLFTTLQGPSCPPTSLPSPVRRKPSGAPHWGPAAHPRLLSQSACRRGSATGRCWRFVGPAPTWVPARRGRRLLPRSSHARARTDLPEGGGLRATGEEQKRKEDRRTQPRAFVIGTQTPQDGQGTEDGREGSAQRSDQSFRGTEDERFFSHTHFSAFSKFSTKSLYCFCN